MDLTHLEIRLRIYFSFTNGDKCLKFHPGTPSLHTACPINFHSCVMLHKLSVITAKIGHIFSNSFYSLLSELVQDKSQWEQTGMQEVPPKYQETLCCACDCALAQVVQRGCWVCLIGVFKSHLDMVLSISAWRYWCPCLRRGLGQMSSGGPFQPQQLCNSVIFLVSSSIGQKRKFRNTVSFL